MRGTKSREIGNTEMMELLIGWMERDGAGWSRAEWNGVSLSGQGRGGSAAANTALMRCFPSARKLVQHGCKVSQTSPSSPPSLRLTELLRHGLQASVKKLKKEENQKKIEISVAVQFGFEWGKRVKYVEKPIELVVSRAIVLFLWIRRLLPVLLMAAYR